MDRGKRRKIYDVESFACPRADPIGRTVRKVTTFGTVGIGRPLPANQVGGPLP